MHAVKSLRLAGTIAAVLLLQAGALHAQDARIARLRDYLTAAAALGHMLLDNDAFRLTQFAVNVRLE